MAERVASLYAEIGANTSGLKAGLASAKAGLAGFAANVKSNLSGAGEAWSNLATPINQTIQILGQVGQAAQQAYAFISEGTQLATTERQFGALSNSIGSTADALLGELKTATRGTISDFELMKSATSIMSLGLADTSEETVRLASLVGKLGWDMNQVTLTLANQSTMRLDSLGLSVSDVTSRVDALKEAGYSADQAFKFAILEAGEEKVKLLGDAADTTAGKLAILEANAANFKDTAQAAFSQELITNINDMAGGLFESADGAASFGEQFGKAFAGFLTGGQFKAAREQVDTLNQSTYNLATQSMPALERQLEQERAAMIASLTAIDDRREAIEAHTEAIEENYASLARAASFFGVSTDEITEQGAELFKTELILRKYGVGVQEDTRYLEDMRYATEEISQPTKDAGEAVVVMTGYIAKSAEALDAFTASTGQYFMTAAEAGGSLGFFNENLADLGTMMVATTVSIGNNESDLELLQDAYDKAANKVDKYRLGIEGATLSEEERAEKIGELQGQMASYQAQMDALGGSVTTYSQRTIEATINQDAVNQSLVESIAAAGGSAAEIGAAALALGTMSEAQVEAAMKAAELEIRIASVRQAYLDGRISADELSGAIQQQIEIVNGMTTSIGTADGSVRLIGDSMVSAAGSTQTLLDKFGAFPDSVGTTVDVDTSAAQAKIDALLAKLGELGGSRPGEEEDARAAGGNIPHNAEGTGFFPGGRTWVGERGPEIVTLPRGSQIASAEQSRQMTGNTYNLYVTAMDGGANVTREFNYMQALAGG